MSYRMNKSVEYYSFIEVLICCYLFHIHCLVVYTYR